MKRLLTSDQDDDASGHGNAGFARFVISSAVGALHSHDGYTQSGHGYNNANDHEGAGCLEGTWIRGKDRVNTSVTVRSIPNLLQVKKVWQGRTGFTRLRQNKPLLAFEMHFYTDLCW